MWSPLGSFMNDPTTFWNFVMSAVTSLLGWDAISGVIVFIIGIALMGVLLEKINERWGVF